MKNYWLDKKKVPNLLSDAEILHFVLPMISEIKEDRLEVDRILARQKMQQLEDLKLQVMAQNPSMCGVWK